MYYKATNENEAKGIIKSLDEALGYPLDKARQHYTGYRVDKKTGECYILLDSIIRYHDGIIFSAADAEQNLSSDKELYLDNEEVNEILYEDDGI